jgi:hypothetical protein
MESRMEERRESALSGVGSRAITIGALVTSAVVHAALVFQHTAEPLLATAFGAAAVAAAAAAFGLTRVELAFMPFAAAALLVGLLLTYPLYYAATGDTVDALGISTKTIEVVGLLAALRARDDHDASLAPVAAIVGFLLAFLLYSVTGGSQHHH